VWIFFFLVNFLFISIFWWNFSEKESCFF
jgi:hypothetical protein